MLDAQWLKTFAPFGVIHGPKQWQPTGACVFVESMGFIWCVTAAHAVTTAEQSVGCLVEIADQPTVIDLTEVLRQQGLGWAIQTPNDIAAAPMPLPSGINIRAVGEDLFLVASDIKASMPCLTAGMPYGLPGVAPDKPTPLVLDGVIAGVDAASDRLFISVPTFPGNSGGPVIVCRVPWNPAGGMTVGNPVVLLAGIVIESVLVASNDPASAVPPLHLGCGVTMNAVKALLASEDARRMAGMITSKA